MPEMTLRSAKIKLLSLFVLTFLCFNAGGAVCVGYCQGFTRSAAQKDHCPLAKFGAHCPKSESSTHDGQAYIEFNENSIDCCVMSIGLIATPVEKRHRASDVVLIAVVQEPQLTWAFVPRTTAEKPFYITYSSAPANKRFTHIKNRVFRI